MALSENTLPIDRLREEFQLFWEDNCNLIVESPTGSGKSTRLPLWCGESEPVVVVEPRRIACRALAHHVAQLDGSPLGQRVGYAVRFDNCYSEQTGILFITPGIALRWLSEGRLDVFPTVILDEFHERRWDTDLLAALLLHIKQHRLILTSATLDGARLAQWLNAERLQAEGRSYPVEVHYSGETELPTTRDLAERVANTVKDALEKVPEGDALVFLPGKGEIEAARQALRTTPNVEIITLHAAVDSKEQDRALQSGTQRRVILATNVAETSLTIPGVTIVIDSGLERRTHHRNGRTVLGLQVISQATAEQRSGRAGRVRPGYALRLWGKQAILEPYTPPEVLREELTDLYLAAAAAGVSVDELEFPDPLPEHARERAVARLQAMDAITDSGELTDHGRRLFPLPLDPLFAHLITAMPDKDSCAAMVDLAAALSVGRSPLRSPTTAQGAEALKEFAPEACDATTLIRLLRNPVPRELNIDRASLKQAQMISDQVRSALELPQRSANEAIPRLSLLHAALKAVPQLAYVRRQKRRDAMGNGIDEVTPARESRLSDEAEAAVVFDTHSVPGRGTNQTLNLGTCMAPVPLKLLVEMDLGEVESGSSQLIEGRIVSEQVRLYAGRVIERETREVAGQALREAAAELILSGALLSPAGARIQQDCDAWNLYLALGMGEGSPVDPRAYIQQQLTDLGIEQQEELDILDVSDLKFDGIPDWQRNDFDSKYPTTIHLHNVEMAVHYEPAKRRVELVRTGGSGKKIPTRLELPPWNGWRVRYRQASKVVDIR